MSDQILVGEVMTPVPQLIEAGACILTAEKLMAKRGFRHLPVTNQGKPFGVISDKDIKLAEAIATDVIDENQITVEEVCSHPAYRVPPEEPLDIVAYRMWQERIDSVLIIDREKIIGIFTTSDACRVLAETLIGKLAKQVNA